MNKFSVCLQIMVNFKDCVRVCVHVCACAHASVTSPRWRCGGHKVAE